MSGLRKPLVGKFARSPLSFSNDATQLIVRRQLYRAGVRLATVLNALFM
jgi:hypothetical protein